MCGIAGIVNLAAGRVDAELLAAMTTRLTHRGPDAHGYHVTGGVGFGHRRLSIIDLAAGKQPMLSDDGRVALTFNGEIYNYRTLRTELEGLGHRFHTHSDTEVLLHAWMAWGEDCAARLRGMFAFAVWDEERQQLYMARDQLGIKPLYYGEAGDGSLLFGSELKALTAHPGFRRDILAPAVEDYFAFGYVPEPRTIYRAAWKLPAGHWLSLRRDERAPRVVRYWDVPFAGDVPRDEPTLAREIVERLKEAVELQLVADVPLGAFLSGGVDSSAVVSLMSECLKDPVRTFSIGFDEPAYDESEHAELMARVCHTAHTRRVVKVDDFGLLDALAGMYDEPYADSSAIPTFRVAELARESVTVTLSGDGGDENFAGYWRYRETLRALRSQALLPPAVRRLLGGPLRDLLGHLPDGTLLERARGKLDFWSRDVLANYMHSIAVVKERERAALFSPALRRELSGYGAFEVLAGHAARAPVHDGLALVQYLDFKTYLVDDILTKVDRTSMANSLEVRVPVLDHLFVEWVSAIPSELKMTLDGEGKHIFKRALEGRLPHDVLYRRKKGFSVPLARWFQGELAGRVQAMLRSELLRDSGYFDPAYLDAMAARLRRGWYECSAQLWAMLMFESFLRK